MDRILIGLERLRKRIEYWGPAINKVRLIESDLVPTMGIDQFARVYWNQRFLNRITDRELEAVLEHEINHYTRGHHFRFMSLVSLGKLTNTKKDMERFNIWADLEINSDVKELPKTALHPKRFGYPVGLTLEEYMGLRIEPEDVDNPGGFGGASQDGEGGDIIIDPSSSDDAASILEEVQREMAKIRGTDTGNGLADIKYRSIKYNWKSVLNNVVGRLVSDREMGSDLDTYSEVNKRMSCIEGVVFPKQYSEDHIIDLLFAVDTSGSMSGQLNKIFSYIKSLKRAHESDSVKIQLSIMQVDADVKSFDYNVKELPTRIHGLGGTDMREIWKYLEEHDLKFDFIVIGTDGYTPWPDPAIDYKKTAVLMTEEEGHHWKCPYKWYRV